MSSKEKQIEKLKEHLSVKETPIYNNYGYEVKNNNKGFTSIILISLLAILSIIILLIKVKKM